jgi:aspartyl-tRNA(Asn)/glutamyl-tRNA(Gln) amidotransferase subunit B
VATPERAVSERAGGWEPVIGIEVHVQLRTAHKLFCLDRAVFGDEPNRHVCPVCLGLPGALPTTNADAVRLAVRTALALGCEVHRESVWARKNYFYPDLPKGYQITQFEHPIATDGVVDYEGAHGPAAVRIRRVHMEEDAGKSLHDRVPGATAVDLNRAGTPLVEIVTEPDLHAPTDVRAFLTTLKQTLEYVDVSDCNMEEGSLRADANVSVRRSGDSRLGTKTEIKNVNSFSGIERALELEIARQVEVLEAGGAIEQQTLLWDDHRGRLRPMRSKEESHDYRYFPDPDLPPLTLADGLVEEIRDALPELPAARRARLVAVYALSEYDARVLTHTVAGADYFEEVAKRTGEPKLAANWVMGAAQAAMNARGQDARSFTVRPTVLAELIGLVVDGAISEAAAKTVLDAVADGEGSPRTIVEERGLQQVRDSSALEAWVREVVEAYPDEVARFGDGEKKLLGFLVGQVMKRSGGKADPHGVNELLRAELS